MPRLIDADAFFNDFPELRDYEYASQEYEVDAEPVRHGHWETVFMSEATGYDPTLANYIDPVFCHRCSVCKEDARLDEYGEEILSKYCLNCGAKMDEHIDTPTDPVAK